CARPRNVFFRAAGKSFFDHGDLRDFRSGGPGTPGGPGGDPAAYAAGAPDFRFPSSPRIDAISAGAFERGRKRSDTGELARVGRHSGADPRERVPGGRPRSRRVRARRTHTDTFEMKKLSHYDSAGNARMVDVSAKQETRRTARAHAFVCITPEVLKKLPQNPK